jgi:(p)ppGpp synthase/HD superfamily hydrolase
MDKSEFLALYNDNAEIIKKIQDEASRLHASVNQLYDGYLPYSFHLRLSASYVTRFAYLFDIKAEEITTIFAAIYFHDSIEDARLTYRDLSKLFTRMNADGCNIDVEKAADIVYALTNEKGKTRLERANDKYYEGIRNTPYAPFLKMCDRLANIRYSTLFSISGKMKKVYKEEMPHFIDSIGNVPQEMIDEAMAMLAD